MNAEIKIIKSESPEQLELIVNDFLLLIDWFDKEVFYFNMVYDIAHLDYVATIVFKRMRFDLQSSLLRIEERKSRIKAQADLIEKLKNLMCKFYPQEFDVSNTEKLEKHFEILEKIIKAQTLIGFGDD